jgi:hypothetical protein
MFFSCSVFFKWLLRWAINVCKAGASLDELAVLEGDIKAALSRVSKEKERILKEKLFVSVHNCSTRIEDRDYSNVFFFVFLTTCFFSKSLRWLWGRSLSFCINLACMIQSTDGPPVVGVE